MAKSLLRAWVPGCVAGVGLLKILSLLLSGSDYSGVLAVDFFQPSHDDSALVAHITQTAFNDGSFDLLKAVGDVEFTSESAPSTNAVVLDRTKQYQTMLGFGGAFTEAAALNWKKLSEADQAEVIHRYFADPKDGGHGYTVGRVPMGSCDFTERSYNFDNVSGDVDLQHFDTGVRHDEESGMLPMIRAAQKLVKERGQTLNVFASPWSPPAWMKNAVDGQRSMTGSAQPVGLNSSYMRPWAKYFSAFIDAYKDHGVDLWGVTPQNEPEFAAAWEACVYTPEYEAQFVRDHLGPVLEQDHPDVKIIGFDHNKDHVVSWAQTLYGDQDAAKYFDGIGVHWYGGLNTQHLNATHYIAPDKFILATEACNCGGVVFKDQQQEWWSRAEKLAIDILSDIKWWSVGWVDWNLVLSPTGGPNHLGNMCDANVIADPEQSIQNESIIYQASYYYMGHFSRFIPPGSKRIDVTSSVKLPPIEQADLLGKKLRFDPCSGLAGMTWTYDQDKKMLSQNGLCSSIFASGYEGIWGITMQKCNESDPSQQWNVGGSPGNQAFSSVLFNQTCITSEKVPGNAVGLDPGVDVQAGIAEACGQVPSGEFQSFQLDPVGGAAFPEAFHIKSSDGNCMLPIGADTITFDAVGFETPDGDTSVIVMNLGEQDLNFELYDKVSGSGAAVSVPTHSIVTYTLPSSYAMIV